MTEHGPVPKTANYPEITPEMVRVGVAEYEALVESYDVFELVKAVYTAMASAEPIHRTRPHQVAVLTDPDEILRAFAYVPVLAGLWHGCSGTNAAPFTDHDS